MLHQRSHFNELQLHFNDFVPAICFICLFVFFFKWSAALCDQLWYDIYKQPSVRIPKQPKTYCLLSTKQWPSYFSKNCTLAFVAWKKRKYKWFSLLLKAALLFLLSGAWAVGLKALYLNTSGSLWCDIPKVIWSAVVALLLFYFCWKMVRSLFESLKFRGKLDGTNFFLFGFMTITIVSQWAKLTMNTSRFVIEFQAYNRFLKCRDDRASSIETRFFISDSFLNTMRKNLYCFAILENEVWSTIFLSPDFCNLLESIFCIGIMIYRKICSNQPWSERYLFSQMRAVVYSSLFFKMPCLSLCKDNYPWMQK